MKKNSLILCLLLVLLPLLLLVDLSSGAAHLSLRDMWTDGLEYQIMWHLRVPRALTALLAGVSLSLSGVMMQTLFRNPLAGPYVLGVSSGATLGVAVLLLIGSVAGFAATSALTVVFAIAGAVGVLLMVMGVSHRLSSAAGLLIVGMMVGAIAGALVNLLQNFADPDSLKLFVIWSLGSLTSVGWSEMVVMAPLLLVGIAVSVYLTKPLNGLLLGENYAQGLGINIRSTRLLIVLSSGLLAGSITAFCGPIAFVGVAVPHLTRSLLRTSSHRLIMPASALLGAELLLLCDAISQAFVYPLPISTVSALFGAPVVITLLLKK